MNNKRNYYHRKGQVFILAVLLFLSYASDLTAQCQTFNVSGGGSYCSGSISADVVLQGSQNYVTYELYHDGRATGEVRNNNPNLNYTQVLTWTVNKTGKYEVYALGSGCAQMMPGSATVSLKTESSLGIQASKSTGICEGESITLTATGGSDYKWYYGGQLQASGSPYPLNNLTVGTHTYTLTGKNNCGNTADPESITITVTPKVTSVPTPTPTSPSTISRCKGAGTSSYSIPTMGNASSYSWQLLNAGNSTISSSGTTGTVTWDANFSGTATVKVTAYGCGGSFASSTLSVPVIIPPAKPTPSHPQGYVNDMFYFRAASNNPAAGTTHEWFADAAGTITASFVVENTNPLVTYVTKKITSNTPTSYWVRTKYSNCYSEFVEVKAQINGTPTLNPGSPLNLKILSGNSVGILNPGPPSSNVIGPHQYQYQWKAYNGTTYNDITDATSATYNPGVLTSNNTITKKYSREVTLKYGNTTPQKEISQASDVTITIYPAFKPGVLSQEDFTICMGETPTLTATAPTGGDPAGTYSYQWQRSSIEESGFEDIPGATNISYTLPSSGTVLVTKPYYRRKTSVNGCCPATDYTEVIKVTVLDVKASLNHTGTVGLCRGTSLTLEANPASADYHYQWTRDGIIIPDASLPSLTVSQQGVYAVEISSGNCSDVSDAVTVTVGETTTVDLLLDEPANLFCKASGEGILLYTYPLENYSYQWKRNGQVVGTNAPSLLATQTGDYVLTVSQNGCLSHSKPITVVNEPININDINYVRSFTALEKNVSPAVTLSGQPDPKQVNITTQYIDGLGRLLQTVTRQFSPLKQDLVGPVQYDRFNREPRKYIPYVADAGDGLMRICTLEEQKIFYQGSDAKVANSAYPYTQLAFEASPLSRVKAETGPGDAWHTLGKSVNYYNRTNREDEKVRAWSVELLNGMNHELRSQNETTTPTINERYYEKGALFVTETTDEQGHTIYEYKDKEDRLVLKKVATEEGFLQTHYVYDVFGNLRIVIPPKAWQLISSEYLEENITLAVDDQLLQDLCFLYDYDQHQRMILKKVPGADYVEMVYDDRDRLVLTQDGEQRTIREGETSKEWTFTKYDALNRPVITGIYASNENRNTLQANLLSFLNSDTRYFEARDVNSVTGYTDRSFPTGVSIADLLTITYYDDYAFMTAEAWGASYAFVNTSGLDGVAYPKNDDTTPAQDEKLDAPRGQVTGSQVKVLGENQFLKSVTYYDYHYRVIQSVLEHLLGGTDRVSNRYDFRGKVKASLREHSVNGGSSLKFEQTYSYDHAERLLSVTHQMEGENKFTLASHQYNEIGELIDKKLHVEGSAFKQSVDYRYNIRGWLTSINNSKLVNDNGLTNDDGNDYFGMELLYEQIPSGLSYYDTPENISTLLASDRQQRQEKLRNEVDQIIKSLQLNQVKAASEADSAQAEPLFGLQLPQAPDESTLTAGPGIAPLPLKENSTTPTLNNVITSGLTVTLEFTNHMAPQGPEGGFELMLNGQRTYENVVPRLYSGEQNLSMTFTLDSAASYCFKIYARWNSGYKTSNQICAQVTAPLAAPTGLTATAISSSVNLAWTDQSADETGFEIERKESTGTYTLIHTTTADVNSYTDNTVAAGVTYYYRIRAINSTNNTQSSYSPEVSVATPTTVPALTNVITSGMTVTLEFTNHMAPQGPEGGFELMLNGQRTYEDIVPRLYSGEENLSMSFTLDSAASYCFKIFARWNSGYKASNQICAQVNSPLETPTGLVATAVSSSSIALQWNDVASETGYIIERRTSAGGFSQITVANVDATSYTDENLTGATTYFYRIKAINATDSSAFGSEVSATTLSNPVAGRVTTDLQALYTFQEGTGSTVADVSEVGSAMNLSIADPAHISWLSGGGLQINSATSLSSGSAAGNIINAAKATNELTLEAWIKPKEVNQTGPARVMTISESSSLRNATIGHNSDGSSYWYQIRIRTNNSTTDGRNGLPLHDYTTGSSTPLTVQHVVVTYAYDAATGTGTERLYIDGVEIGSHTRTGDFQNSWSAASPLILGNESGGGRAWLGTYYLAAVYSRALSSTEVTQNYQAGYGAAPSLPAPSNLTAQAFSYQQINLSWQDNASEEEGFYLERKTENTDFVTIDTLQANAVSYSDQGLLPYTTYTYRIKAFHSNGNSVNSNEVVTTTLPLTPLQRDSLALLALYHNTQGTEWDITQPLSMWSGVQIVNGRVKYLRLGSKNISGTIPPEIGNLSDLEILNLSFNELTGTIPDEIRNLTNLTYLGLNYNKLSGQIPASIGNLIKLVTLHLYFNQFTGEVPSSLTSLQNLAVLTLHNNQLTTLPDLTSLTKLTRFDVEYNRFSFEDLIPNLPKGNIFHYIPQENILPLQSSVSITVDENAEIGLATGHTAGNNYEWFKDDVSFATTSINKLSFVNPDFDKAGVYTCKVTNPAVPSLVINSEPITVTVIEGQTIPTAPSNLALAVANAGSLEITWSDARRETGYHIERKTTGGTYAVVGSVGSNVTRFIDQQLSPATTYIYKVTAFNSNGNSAYSAELSATTQAASEVASPVELLVKTSSPYSVELRWKDESTQETGYEIQKSHYENGPFTTIHTTAANVTTFVENSLSPSTRYFYRVRAIDNNSSTASDYSLISGTATYSLATPEPLNAGLYKGQYNGNIAGIIWNSNAWSKPQEKIYSFTYDAVNRLTAARYAETNELKQWSKAPGHFSVEDISYDENGNIQSLKRFTAEGGRHTIDELSYHYGATNQLQHVSDVSKIDAGFADGNTTGNDFHYDANGNLDLDKNKHIESIKYNELNLPREITFKKEGKQAMIRYSYDASGNKLAKEVTDFEGKVTTTFYIAGIEYVQDHEGVRTLEVMHHQEGRVKPKAEGGYVYHYDLKDHLGNVRVTFASETQTDEYTASMEIETSEEESAYFTNYDDATFIQNTNYDHTNSATSSFSHRLSAGQGEVIGLAKSLPVKKGDKVHMEVYATYVQPTTQDATAVANIGAALANALMQKTPGGLETAGMIDYIGDVLFAGGPVLDEDDWEDASAPKAFLNYIFFDEHYVYQKIGFNQISLSAKTTGTPANFDQLVLDFTAEQSGYLYIYLSNESAKVTEVFFDDFLIQHEHSVIVGDDSYYPFGLTFNQNVERSLTNKYLYNGKELQDELGLDWYDYGARMYDPSIGRFHVQDIFATYDPDLTPYRYAFNNPVNVIDPTGNYEVYVNGERVRGRDKQTAIDLFGLPTEGGGEDDEDNGTTEASATATAVATKAAQKTVELSFRAIKGLSAGAAFLTAMLSSHDAGSGSALWSQEDDVRLKELEYYESQGRLTGQQLEDLRKLRERKNSFWGDVTNLQKVGQWMTPGEYEEFKKTGIIPRTNVLVGGPEGYEKQAGKGDYYVEFSVDPSILMLKDFNRGWYLVRPKNLLQRKLYENKGIPIPSPIGYGIKHVKTK